MAKLYKRAGRKGANDPYYALYKDYNDNWVRKNTGFSDKKLAQEQIRQFQEQALNPEASAQNAATLRDALNLLIEDRTSKAKAGLRSKETVEFYKKHCGALEVLIGENTPLRNITSATIDAYIKQRRSGVGENTVSKDLITLRCALKLAARSRIWKQDLSIFPIGFSPQYVPRRRFLTLSEVHDFASVMPPSAFAIMAFSIATSAEWSAICRALPEDISDDFKTCRVRGSKNSNRDRTIPILLPECQELLRLAKKYAIGDGVYLFDKKGGFQHALFAAEKVLYPCTKCVGPKYFSSRRCKACKAVHVCPTDLRRTHATWLKQAGVHNDDIGPMLGHAPGSTMVARVYGRMTPLELEPQIRKQLERNK